MIPDAPIGRAELPALKTLVANLGLTAGDVLTLSSADETNLGRLEARVVAAMIEKVSEQLFNAPTVVQEGDVLPDWRVRLGILIGLCHRAAVITQAKQMIEASKPRKEG